MDALKDYVAEKLKTPKLTAAVVDGKIVDGVAGGTWTAEDLAADAFADGVVEVDTDWEELVGRVRAIMAVGL